MSILDNTNEFQYKEWNDNWNDFFTINDFSFPRRLKYERGNLELFKVHKTENQILVAVPYIEKDLISAKRTQSGIEITVAKSENVFAKSGTQYIDLPVGSEFSISYKDYVLIITLGSVNNEIEIL